MLAPAFCGAHHLLPFRLVQLAPRVAAAVLIDHRVKRIGNHRLVNDRGVVDVVVDEHLLTTERTRRSEAWVVIEVVIPLRGDRKEVDPLSPVVPSVEGENRIIAKVAMLGVEIVTREITSLGVSRAVIITKVVMAMIRSHEQVYLNRRGAQQHTWPVEPAGIPINRLVKDYGREPVTTGIPRMIPVAADQNAAARRPTPITRNPYPVGTADIPITGTPHELCLVEFPTARGPNVVCRWGGAHRTGFQ